MLRLSETDMKEQSRDESHFMGMSRGLGGGVLGMEETWKCLKPRSCSSWCSHIKYCLGLSLVLHNNLVFTDIHEVHT